MKQRSSQIKNIEKMLHEIASVFKNLGTMVKMQETMVDRLLLI